MFECMLFKWLKIESQIALSGSKHISKSDRVSNDVFGHFWWILGLKPSEENDDNSLDPITPMNKIYVRNLVDPELKSIAIYR